MLLTGQRSVMGKWTDAILTSEEGASEEGHVPVEDLARLADGRVDGQEREGLIRHVNRCARCYEVLSSTLAELSIAQRRSRWFERRRVFALAASFILVVLLGGRLLYRYYERGPQVIRASILLDQGLRDLLLEDESLTWTKGERVDRLSALLQDRGVKVKGLQRVELSAPYLQSKAFFGPKETLRIRVEEGVAYLEVIKEEERERPGAGSKRFPP
jgi:hypothetical protein